MNRRIVRHRDRRYPSQPPPRPQRRESRPSYIDLLVVLFLIFLVDKVNYQFTWWEVVTPLLIAVGYFLIDGIAKTFRNKL